MDGHKPPASAGTRKLGSTRKLRRSFPGNRRRRRNRPGLEEGGNDDNEADEPTVQALTFDRDRQELNPSVVLIACSRPVVAAPSPLVFPVADASFAASPIDRRSDGIVNFEIGLAGHNEERQESIHREHGNEHHPSHEQDLQQPSSAFSMTEMRPPVVVNGDPLPACPMPRLQCNSHEIPGAFRIDGYRTTSEAIVVDVSDSESGNNESPLSRQIQQLHDRVETLQRQVIDAYSTVAVAAEVISEQEYNSSFRSTSALAGTHMEGLARALASVETYNIPLVEAQPVEDNRMSCVSQRMSSAKGGCILARLLRWHGW